MRESAEMKKVRRHAQRILYIQFTNPTAYPPLEHSALLLEKKGWEIYFAGVRWNDSGDFEFSSELRARLSLITAPKRKWIRKLFYGMFIFHAIDSSLRVRPSWVYVSDPVASPAGLIISLLGFKVIYHEHDSPNPNSGRRFNKLIIACRKKLAQRCAVNIIPQESRKTFFIKDTQTDRPVIRVWNCPRKEEVSSQAREVRNIDQPLGIYYHGSITLQRVPLALIEAAGKAGCPVLLRVVGYETIGSKGTTALLKKAAQAYEDTLRLETPGPQADRKGLFKQMQGMQVGWIAYNEEVEDLNLQHLAGASNKAFDYLAAGLGLFINDTPEWVEIFRKDETAIPCNIKDIDKLSELIRWAHENPRLVAEMGERGRQLIASTHNYSTQFRPVLEFMENRGRQLPATSME